MYMFVPCVREKEDNPPTLVKLRPCQGNDCTKIAHIKRMYRVLAKKCKFKSRFVQSRYAAPRENNIQQ